MPKHIIGTIFTKLKGEKIAYYPKTIGTAIEDGSIPFEKFEEDLQDRFDNGLMSEEERDLFDQMINNGGSNDGDIGLPLTRYDGVVIANTNNQKTFTLTLEADMPNVEKMSLDVHVNSVWIAPCRYTVNNNILTLKENEEGLNTGEALHYTLHYGKVSGTSIGVQTQTIVIKDGDTNKFLIEMPSYVPSDTKIMPVIGSAVIVEDRYKITEEGGKYYITFNDYSKFAIGKVIVLYFFSNTNALILSGGSVKKMSLSVNVNGGKEVTIPVDDFSESKYQLFVYKNSTYIAPRRYTIDAINGKIIMNDSEPEFGQDEIVDLDLIYVEKELNAVANKTIDKIYSNIKYRNKTLVKSEWVSDTTYLNYPFSITVEDNNIRENSLVEFTMKIRDKMKYDDKIYPDCEPLRKSFKIYSNEKPAEDIVIKYTVREEME